MVLGTHSVLLLTLDTLRYDVARDCLAAGRTPNLAGLIGDWEERHTPGSFTYAAHHAFFAGFLPTPTAPGAHPRRFAVTFGGATTIGPDTVVFDAAGLPEGFARSGYHTACIGGTGFFNQQNPLGRVLPSRFAEAHWSPELGVTDPRSFEHQIALAAEILAAHPEPAFLFVNVSAIHQPNSFYAPDGTVRDRQDPDSLDTHASALCYVDRHLPKLVQALDAHGPWFGVLCADHGTCYGEDGHTGHRLAHPVVWSVPYAEVLR